MQNNIIVQNILNDICKIIADINKLQEDNFMENDLCNYETDYVAFQNASKELEKKVQKYIKDFKLERFD